MGSLSNTFFSFLIPLVGMALGGFVVAVVFFFIYRIRMIEHKENLAAIEKGILPKEMKSRRTRYHHDRQRSYARRATWWLSVGIGLTIALWVSAPHSPAWVWGFFLAVIGLGYLVYWTLFERHGLSETESHKQDED
ncbi:MAG: DUF6249 domain-containing protein [Acidobacteriota bacterium]